MISALLLALASPVAAEAPPEQPARMDHVALQVADLARSVAFYQRIFGFAEIEAPVEGPRWLSVGGALALHLLPGRTEPVRDNRYVHLAFTVQDFDAMVGRLVADKVAFGDFAGNPGAINRVRGDGVRQVFLRDPDGYWIEVNDAARH